MYLHSGGLKGAVTYRADFICETPNCTEDMNSIHHIVKVSIFPEIKYCSEFVMACCGKHHALIEQRIREHGEYKRLYPAWARLRCEYWCGMSKEERNIYLQHCTFYRRI